MTATTPAALTPTIAAVRRQLAQRFRDAGLESPELDARILVGHALGLDHAALAAQSERPLSPREADAVAAVAQRRLDREPVARILGLKEFWGLPIKLNADTLVPRPETETVVEAALAALGDTAGDARRIADLDTGSGALLLALLSELPAAWGVGTDISVTALACARANAAALGLAGRAAFVACDHGTALGGGFDLVVANPPYVATRRYRGIAVGGAPARSAPGARRRRGRVGGLSGARGRRTAVAGAPRRVGGRAWRRPVGGGCGPLRGRRAGAGSPVSCRPVGNAARPRLAAPDPEFFTLNLKKRHTTPSSQPRKKALGLWDKTD